MLEIRLRFDAQKIRLIHKKIALAVETNRIIKNQNELTACGGRIQEGRRTRQRTSIAIYRACSSEILTALLE